MNGTFTQAVSADGLGEIVLNAGAFDVGYDAEHRPRRLPVKPDLAAAEDAMELKLVDILKIGFGCRPEPDLVIAAEGIAEIAADIEACPVVDRWSFNQVCRFRRCPESEEG